MGNELKAKTENNQTLQTVKSCTEPLSVKQSCDVGKELICLDNKTAVSVVGLFNRGKTFLLNLITGMGLPAGKKYTTKGLSFATPRDKTVAQSLYVIDKEGSNASLSKNAIEGIGIRKNAHLNTKQKIQMRYQILNLRRIRTYESAKRERVC